MTPNEKYNQLNGEKLINSLAKRNIQGFYCDTKEDALKKAIELLPEKNKISWGGSKTLLEIGLIDYLKSHDYQCLDRADAKTPEESEKIAREAFFADYYLLSANAITSDGIIVNMDGIGNRVAALIYGPKNVLMVVGINKITPDLDTAIARVRQYASPMNAIRLERNTPCKDSGTCYNCKTEACICCHLSISRMSRTKDRAKLILVGENLGF